MRYDYYTMKGLVGDEAHLIKKIDLAIVLGISRPTLDNWLNKYRRDIKLIKDNSSEQDYKLTMYRDFIKMHLKVNGKYISSSEVDKIVEKWSEKWVSEIPS